MIDICDGNIETNPKYRAAHTAQYSGHSDVEMCKDPTNPIAYASDLGIETIFRFILTHPDMDHLDGFDALCDAMKIVNYWDTGTRRDKLDFSDCQYLEADWDRYERVRDNKQPGTSSRTRRVGDPFDYAKTDGLRILAPDDQLVKDCNMEDDVNDGSYVVLYRAAGNRIILPGDAHDNTWNYVWKKWSQSIANVSFLLAPHHGRDSQRSYDFLDVTRPALTLIGCAPEKYVDCDQWKQRNLAYVRSDECGNVVLEARKNALDVYIENLDFVVAAKQQTREHITRNSQNYGLLTTIAARDSDGHFQVE